MSESHDFDEDQNQEMQNSDLHEPEEEQPNDNSFLSIWDMVGSYAQSPLETMLSKENINNITLDQVLDEETLIQEIKAANAKVVEYIAKKDNIQKLLYYLTAEYYKEDQEKYAKELKEDELTKRIFKYPYIACEVICCDTEEINEQVVENDETIMKLFSFLSSRDAKKSPLNPSLAQYFTKTVTTLLQKHYSKIVVALMGKDSESFNVLKTLFVDNIGLCDMDSLTLKLLGFETKDENAFVGGGGEGEFGAFAAQQRLRELLMMKQRGNDKQLEENKKKMQQWSIDKGIVQMLLDKIEADSSDEDVTRNIFTVLTEIVEKGNAVVHSKILAKDTLTRVLNIILSSNNTTIYVHGLVFLRTVIDASDMYTDGANAPEALAVIHSRTKDFIDLLGNDKQGQTTITTTFGDLSPPLGEKRLKTVDHLQLLFKCGHRSIHQDLIDLQALQKLLDLFFQYPYNNMLHCAVFAIVRHIIESAATPELKRSLIVDCKVIERIIETFSQNEQLKSKGQRLGNMGHIVEISNLLKKAVDQQETTLAALVPEVKGWKEFVDGCLAEINLVNGRQLGGPVPIGSSFPGASSNIYNFNSNTNEEEEDEDDDVYVDEEDEEDSDDSEDSDDEVIVKKEQAEASAESTTEEKPKETKSAFRANAITGGDEWEADFNEF